MFPEKYSVLVLGPPAAGLLEFCTYLASFYIRNDQSVVFVEADTSATIIRRQLSVYGMRGYEDPLLSIIDCYSSPSQHDDMTSYGDPARLPELYKKIKEALSSSQASTTRVIFDSLSPLFIYSTPEEVMDFIRRLSELAKKSGSLTITMHQEMHVPEQVEAIVTACDGLIELRVDDRMTRYIRISRMRLLDVEPKWVPFDLGLIIGTEGTSLLWNGKGSESKMEK